MQLVNVVMLSPWGNIVYFSISGLEYHLSQLADLRLPTVRLHHLDDTPEAPGGASCLSHHRLLRRGLVNHPVHLWA